MLVLAHSAHLDIGGLVATHSLSLYAPLRPSFDDAIVAPHRRRFDDAQSRLRAQDSVRVAQDSVRVGLVAVDEEDPVAFLLRLRVVAVVVDHVPRVRHDEGNLVMLTLCCGWRGSNCARPPAPRRSYYVSMKVISAAPSTLLRRRCRSYSFAPKAGDSDNLHRVVLQETARMTSTFLITKMRASSRLQ